MGNWTIVVKGVGVHHNGVNDEGEPSVPEDADLMAKAFVEDLRSKGHSIESATITQHGGDENLLE